jgi:teichuronic acid biosynthesis glycosyltransferase TuaG
MSDLISVIISFYKKSNYLKKTINSLANQTFKNYEVILVYDDPDKSDLQFVKNCLKKIKNKKIILNKKNHGAGLSRNYGVKKAKGTYITFLDADDLWHKNKLKNQIYFMKKKKIQFSFTNYSIISEDNKIIKKIKSPKNIEYKDLLYSCDIALSSVMIKSNLLKDIRFPNLKTKEDYVLWLKLSKKNIKMLGINKNLTYWRKTPNSLSSSTIQKFKDGFTLYHKFLSYNILNSLVLTLILSLNFIKKRYL